MYLIEASPLSKGLREPSLTYHSPVPFKRGDIITVPLRSSTVLAIVIESVHASKDKQSLRKERERVLKSVIGKKASGALDPVLFATCEQLSHEYISSVGSILAAIIPEAPTLADSRTKRVTKIATASSSASKKTAQLIGPSRERWTAFLKKNKAVSIIVLPTRQMIKNCVGWMYAFDPDLTYVVQTPDTKRKTSKKAAAARALPPIKSTERQCIITTPHEAYAVVLALRSAKVHAPAILIDAAEHIAWRDRRQPYISHAVFLRRLAEGYGMRVSVGAFTHIVGEQALEENAAPVVLDHKTQNIAVSYRDPDAKTSSLAATINELRSQDKTRLFVLSPRSGVYGYIECQDCKTVVRCPSCSLPIGIALQDERRSFSCGHCGFEGVVKNLCENCHGHRLNLRGPGTIVQMEEIAAAVAGSDPQPLIMAFDKTIESKPEKMSETLASSARLSSEQIIVGTSYVLEHADFDRFDAAIIVRPETLLAYPDYRTVTRARLLLRRLADHAKEIACIDARPDSGLELLYMNDEEFLKTELTVRKAVRMPPFSRLCRIEYSGFRSKHMEGRMASLVTFCEALEKEIGLTVRILPVLNTPSMYRFAAIVSLPLDYTERTDIQRSLRSLPPWAECIIDPDSISW